MRKIANIEVELSKDIDTGVKFYAKQFDDLKIKATIFDGTEVVELDNQQIDVFILKEDKTIIQQSKDIEVVDNSLVIDLTKQATTKLGKCSMEILLTDEEGTASTSTISYIVAEKLSASILDIIKSEDDIEILKTIEDFIETSNVDILEIKEAIEDVRGKMTELSDNLDAKHLEIVEALTLLEAQIVERIEAKTSEAINRVDSVIEDIDTALERAEGIEDTVNNALSKIEGIEDVVDNALSDIESHKVGAISAVDNTKVEATSAVEACKVEAISVVEEKATEINAELDVVEAGIIANINEEKEAVIEVVNNALDSIGDIDIKVEEGVECLETAKTRSVVIIEEASSEAIADISNRESNVLDTVEEAKVEAINAITDKITEVEASLVELNNELKAELSKTSEGIAEELQDTVTQIKKQAETDIQECKTVLDSYLEAIKTDGREEIDTIKDTAVNELNAIKEQVDNTLASISEKVVEGNECIDELTALIAEAREVAGLVRAFIDSHAVDLSNYYTKDETYSREEVDTLVEEAVGSIEIPSLEGLVSEEQLLEAINGIEIPEVDLSHLATKEELEASKTELNANIEEVNNAVEGIREEVNNIDLSGYYTKEETYTKEEVDTLIDNVGDIDISNIYTKEEVDALFDNIGITGDFKGEVGGTISRLAPIDPTKFIKTAPAGFEKHNIKFRYYNSGNNYYTDIYFNCDLDNNPDKYVKIDNSGKLVLVGMTKDVDYKGYYGTSTTSANLSSTATSFNLNNGHDGRIYSADFNIYNNDKTEYIIEKPKEGIADLNDANQEGYYSINLTEGQFDGIGNRPFLKRENKDVVGYVEIKLIGGKVAQKLTLISHNKTFVRIVGQMWQDTTEDVMKKEKTGVIRASSGELSPDFLRNIPPNYEPWKSVEQRYIFQYKEGYIDVVECFSSSNIAYISYEEFKFSKDVSECYCMRYNLETGEWIREHTPPSGLFKYPHSEDTFILYEATNPIYNTTNVNSGKVVLDIKRLNFDVETTISDFNEANVTGNYEIDIKANDEIINSPVSEKDFKGVLIVNTVEDMIYQEARETSGTEYKRTYNGTEWSEWKSNTEEIGMIQGVMEPTFDELTSTFTGYPENTDNYPYKMMIEHYDFNIVFYFPQDPTGKFGVKVRDDGKLGLSLIDSTYTYTNYKGYYRKANATSGTWTALQNENHFSNPDTRDLTKIFYHNFNLVNADNPKQVLYLGEGCSTDENIVVDFNNANKLEKYEVINTTGILYNAPHEGELKGVLFVSTVGDYIVQELITDSGSLYRRICNNTNWTEWK